MIVINTRAQLLHLTVFDLTFCEFDNKQEGRFGCNVVSVFFTCILNIKLIAFFVKTEKMGPPCEISIKPCQLDVDSIPNVYPIFSLRASSFTFVFVVRIQFAFV